MPRARGIGGVQVQRGGLAVHRVAMAESRIHAVVVLGRNQLQRISPRAAPRRHAAIPRAACNPASPRGIGTCRRRVPKPPSANGRNGCPGAHAAARSARAPARSSVMPRTNGCGGIEQRADHVVFRVAEAGVVEAHARRPAARKISTFDLVSPGGGKRRAARAAGSSGRRPVEVGVLQERGGGQQDIGVVGGVGLELLQHHGEQIVAPQAAQHGVLVGRDGGGVRIVDHQGLHRRIVQRR